MAEGGTLVPEGSGVPFAGTGEPTDYLASTALAGAEFGLVKILPPLLFRLLPAQTEEWIDTQEAIDAVDRAREEIAAGDFKEFEDVEALIADLHS